MLYLLLDDASIHPPQLIAKIKLLRFSQTFHFMKSKSQLTFAFFAAVNHLNGLHREQNFTLTGSKGHGF